MSTKHNITLTLRDGTTRVIDDPLSFGFTNGFMEIDYADKVMLLATDKIQEINVTGVMFGNENSEEVTHAASKVLQ